MTSHTTPDHTDLLDVLEPTTLEDLDVDSADHVHGGYWTTGMSSAPMPS